MVRHVVWDWNGTLLDDFHLVVTAASAACTVAGRGAVTAEEYQACFTRPIETSYERLLGRPLAEGEWDRLTATFHESYLGSVATAELAPDALEALAVVDGSGRTQSVLSMWSHDQLVPMVAGFGIEGRFSRVDGQPGFGGGHKEEHLRRHLDALAVRADEALLIGDTVDDAHAAAAAGARCVLVSSGMHVPADLAACDVPLATSLLEALELGGVEAAEARPSEGARSQQQHTA
ncbi:MAG: HAD family hydrolase [Acidimicrobiales bacterium]